LIFALVYDKMKRSTTIIYEERVIHMARYGKRFPMNNVDMNYVASAVGEYMTNEGFKLVDYRGQQVWKKGVGLLTAPQYLVISFFQDEVIVEAFLRFALFPGVYVGEMGIDGFFGAVPKSLLKTRVQAVEAYLVSIIQYQQNAYAAAAQQQSPPVQ